MTAQTEAADMQCALASLRLMALFAERALRTGRTAIALAHIQDMARALDEIARVTQGAAPLPPAGERIPT